MGTIGPGEAYDRQVLSSALASGRFSNANIKIKKLQCKDREIEILEG